MGLKRFLLEVEDNLKLRQKNHLLTLTQAEVAVSPLIAAELAADFLRGVPLAYLLGHAEFYGQQFTVNPKVLIPRPETEQLVDLLVKSGKHFPEILDVGTGSGVIGLSLLLSNTASQATLADISPAAIEIAAVNAGHLRLDNQCKFVLSDRLSKISGQFDLIVSNPPYIKPRKHQNLVQETVLRYEPGLALFVEDDAYHGWFLEFFKQVKNRLKPGGLFMMEGHEQELEGQALELKQLGFQSVEVLSDWNKHPRFLRGLA